MLGSSKDILDRMRTREVTGVFHSRKALVDAAEELLVSGIDRAEIDVSASVDELDRIESVLRSRDLFTSRHEMAEASELVRGRDPDNQPLVFICYAQGETLGPDYYRAVANMVYALDT